ncbi:hypothetical protein GCM10027569_02230 [Flindersiella endophytica]
MAPLAVLLLAGLVAGCSAEPEKQPAAASTPTASQAAEHAAGTVRTTATARSSATQMALDPKVAAEAQAFVREFMAASDRATASGDFSNVKPMVAKDCAPCQASIAYFAKLYAAGGSVTGGAFVSPRLSAAATTSKDEVRVTVKARIAPYTVKESSRGRGVDYPAEQVTYTYMVRKARAGWQVVGRSF